MPYNGVGVFQRVYQWVNDASNSIFVDATRTDTDSNDIADGLTNCITRDGQSPAIANLPMGGFKFTGLGAGVNPTDSVNFLQVFTAPSFTGGVTVTGGLGVAGGLAVTGGVTGTGAINFSNATSLTGPTPLLTDNGNTIPTTAWVVQKQFGTALPAQTGNAGKFITTDGTNASWANPLNVFRSARTANVALAVSDKGTLVDITANTFTQTFSAAATLASGWYCWLRNAGTGDITLDPNGAELIDGLTSYVMYPGEARLVQCDGAQFTSVVIHGFSKTFISSGTFILPPGYASLTGEAWGAGGSGGVVTDSTGNSTASGAGGGPCLPFSIPTSALTASTSVVIGAGGVAVTTNANGNNGGNTTFGPVVSYGGGAGAIAIGASSTGGSGAGVVGPGSAGSPGGNIAGGGANTVAVPGTGFEGGGTSNGSQGSSAVYGGGGGGGATQGNQRNGGASIYGGGGGGGTSAAGASSPGASKFGGSGGAGRLNSNGDPGIAPGGGGGASVSTVNGTNYISGAGARGELRIRGVV